MLRSLIALALVAAPVPAIPETVPPIPIDYAARAKFPRDPGTAIDALAAFNSSVNGSMTYVSDKEHYGVSDHYVSMPPDMKGDCEDYALTKMEALSAAGFPVISRAKLVMVVVHVGKEVFGHAILAVLLPSGDVAYLDMVGEPMTRNELKAKGYEFFDWRA